MFNVYAYMLWALYYNVVGLERTPFLKGDSMTIFPLEISEIFQNTCFLLEKNFNWLLHVLFLHLFLSLIVILIQSSHKDT